MSARHKFLRYVLPVLIVFGAMAATVAMVKSRSEPNKTPAAIPGALVEVTKASATDKTVYVKNTGTVTSSRVATVVPQVSGLVKFVAPSLVAGGMFREGELMFEVEPTDYMLALESARAAEARAEVDLETIKSRAKIARQEWDSMSSDGSTASGGEPNPLVLYAPQLRNAEAGLASARATVKLASLNLERTAVKAPFNCRVRAENIERGQFVSPGFKAAELAGTDTAEITIPLPYDELAWFEVPGAPATVSMEQGGRTYTWDATVQRTLGELDMKSRTMQVVATVNDPYGLESKGAGIPLVGGAFVNVSIKGRRLRNVFVLPVDAMRNGDTLWVMDETGALRIHQADVIRRERAEVIIEGGISDGDMVVTSALSGASDGMRLRTMDRAD